MSQLKLKSFIMNTFCYILVLCLFSYSSGLDIMDPAAVANETLRLMKEKTNMSEEEIKASLKEILRIENSLGLEKSLSFDITCFFCSAFGDVLVDIVGWMEDDAVLQMAKSLCIGLRIEPQVVCNGAVDIQGPTLVYVARQMDLSTKIPELCSTLLEKDCDDATGEEWTVQLPDVPKPPVEEVTDPEPGSPTMKVLHFGDLHYDQWYSIGSMAVCDDPMCCRGEPAPNTTDPSQVAGRWGSYTYCDSPHHLLENIMEQIAANHKDIDYILMTGDGPAHDLWLQTREDNMAAMFENNRLVRKYFPGIPVYPVPGNHEINPANCYHPADSSIPEELNGAYLTKAIWDDWTLEWLPEEMRSDELFYNAEVVPGLRVIGLQSNFQYNLNWWNFLFDEDPAGQLAWLTQQLQAAEDAGDKVHMFFHHPPGFDSRKAYGHNFWRILNRYENTIRGMFCGHTHKDHYQLVFDAEDPERATGVVYVCPSGTPWKFLNPAYRIYTIDGNYEGSTFAVLDHETHYMDLEKANSAESNYTPEWNKLYSAKEAYGLENLQPQQWYEFAKKMADDDDAFDLYYSHWHRKSSAADSCNFKCKKQRLCDIVTVDMTETDHCDQLTS